MMTAENEEANKNFLLHHPDVKSLREIVFSFVYLACSPQQINLALYQLITFPPPTNTDIDCEHFSEFVKLQKYLKYLYNLLSRYFLSTSPNILLFLDMRIHSALSWGRQKISTQGMNRIAQLSGVKLLNPQSQPYSQKIHLQLLTSCKT